MELIPTMVVPAGLGKAGGAAAAVCVPTASVAAEAVATAKPAMDTLKLLS
jgi:hypothetical protein